MLLLTVQLMKPFCSKIQKVSAAKEAHKNIESDLDQNKLYQMNNMSFEDTKDKLE